MTRRLLLLAAGGGFLLLALGSCRTAGTTVNFVPLARLNLSVRFANGDLPGTCGSYQSWLLRLGSTTSAGWSSTLLYDASRDVVFGCGNAASECTDLGAGELGFDIGHPNRVMIEGLDVTPQDFAARTGQINVLCRGIADPLADPASLTVGTSIDASLTLLQVGAGNRVGNDSALVGVEWGAAASLSAVSPLVLGTGEAGAVLVAGGVVPGTSPQFQYGVWRFSPRSVSFSNGGALDPTAGPAGMSATLFQNTDGRPEVLLAGGSSSAGSSGASDLAEVADPSGKTVLLAAKLTTPRAFHAALWLPAAGNSGAVALLGGTGFDSQSGEWPTTGSVTAPASSTIEYFVPPNSNLGTGCFSTTSPTFCQGTPQPQSVTGTARGFAASAVSYLGPAAPTIWLFGGIGGTLETGLGTVDRIDFAQAPIAHTTLAALLPQAVAGGFAGVLESSGNGAMGGAPVVAGGLTSFVSPERQATSAAAWLDTSSTLHSLGAGLATPRFGGAAVNLRDHSLALFGGVGPSAEVSGFLPNPKGGGGAVQSLGQLRVARFGNTATPLTATRSWLDGAVLLTGGGTEGAELWVPAYACGSDGIHPVRKNSDGSPDSPVGQPWNVVLPPLCDRGRLAEEITDPRNGQLISP